MAQARKKILCIFGTRPEAIKLAPVIVELKKYPQWFEVKNVVSSQHKEMLAQVLKQFGLLPDYDLDIMRPNQTLSQIVVRCLEGLPAVFEKEKPDMILVQGDTTTVFAAAFSAFCHKIPVGHVEAGLRTFHKYNPYPEEINRVLTGHIADLHFAPTLKSFQNLAKENINKQNIFITGNTVIDALLMTVKKKIDFSLYGLDFVKKEKRKLVLVTTHRRESFGSPMRETCRAIKRLAKEFEKKIYIILPVHKNPKVREVIFSYLSNLSNVYLVEPLDYFAFAFLIKESFFILTDSGGVQEEAPSLGKPVLVLRETTERPEAVKSGTVKLVGTNADKIYGLSKKLLLVPGFYKSMQKPVNPYGDGKASQRIAGILAHYFGFARSLPKGFKGEKNA